MQIYKVGVILVIGLWLLANSQASAQTGPVNNPSTSTLFVDYQPPPRSYALVIGNDSYPEKPLENARHDAKLVAETLRRLHGFEVDLQLDLTSLQLRQKIRDFFDYMGQHKDARLLLWFAGHGASVDVRGESHGFLLPIDAPVTSPERRIVEIINKGVDVQGLRERIQKYVQARHVMVVIDSCFAGAVMVEPRKRGPDKESTTPAPERWNNPVRHFIAAVH